MADFYELLEVSREASEAEIKKAYRQKAMKYHPDRNPGDKQAEEMFKKCADAYRVLSDPDMRGRYDRFGEAGINGAAAGGAGFHGVEDIFSAFGDLFGDFFGGRSGRRGPARGADLRLDLRLEFAEAVGGVTKEVDVSRRVACEACKGSGAKPGTSVDTCRTCGGKGQVVHAQGFFMIQTTCPHCRGEGKTIRDRCGDCRGAGLVEKSGKLTVTIPAGIDDGQTLRLSGQGEGSPNGGHAGNLFVVVHVVPDERFHRDGDDVLSVVPISYLQACLGADIEVPTLEDGCTATATISIDPGTQPGEVTVRRGKGVPRVGGRGRGDHHIQWKVEIPAKLSAREKELLTELAQESGDTRAEAGASHRGKRGKGLFGRMKG